LKHQILDFTQVNIEVQNWGANTIEVSAGVSSKSNFKPIDGDNMDETLTDMELFQTLYVFNDPIFKNKLMLEEEYVPTKLISRDKEIKKIGFHLQPIISHSSPVNIMLIGENGLGKTACTKKVVRITQTGLKSISDDYLDMVCINCNGNNDTGVCQIILSHFNIEQNAKGFSIFENMNVIWEHINKEARKHSFYTVLFFFDEIDKLNINNRSRVKDKSTTEMLYQISRANALELIKAPNCRVGIITATNQPLFMKTIPKHITSSAAFSPIFFVPYTKEDLNNIMMARMDAFRKDVLDPKLLEYVAEEVADRYGGDARRAIKTIRIAGEIALEAKQKTITMENIIEAENHIYKVELANWVESKGKHDKYVLIAAYLAKKHMKDDPSMSDVYSAYECICKILDLKASTYETATTYINNLYDRRLLDIRKGDTGNTKAVILSEDINKSIDAIYEGDIRDKIEAAELDVLVTINERKRYKNKRKTSR
jgi:archaeal cell division control protein 6